MTNNQIKKLTGQVISIETGEASYNDQYWVDVGLKLIDGNFVNINYEFTRESVRDNIVNSIEKGMTITVTPRGAVNMDAMFDYSGIGSIQIQDLSNELDRYLKKRFRQSEDSYFSEQETALICQMLESAKNRIKESFDPDDERMERVEEHLDSLARKTPSATKYDWRRLFVSCVVSISIDLGFGASVPEVLYNLFKKLAEEFVGRMLPPPQ